VACDALGHFKMQCVEGQKTTLAIERDGDVVAEVELDPATRTGELVLELPPRQMVQDDARALEIRRNMPLPLGAGVIDRLRALSPRLGIDDQPIRAVARALDELEEISVLAQSALAGNAAALKTLRAGFEREVPFDFELGLSRFKPGPRDFGVDPCSVVPRSPWAIVKAGMVMDAGGGTLWAGRAVSAILRRSEPAVLVARAVSGLEAGQVGEDRLRDALGFAAEMAEGGALEQPLWERFGELSGKWGGRPGLSTRMLPFDPRGVGGAFGVPPRPSLFATLLDPCNLEWLECANTFVTQPPPKPNMPPRATVDETDFVAGQAAQVKLTVWGGGGASFGATKDPDWEIVVGGMALVPTSWSDTEIVLDIPALPPGCYTLQWIVFDRLAAAINDQSDACALFFGNNRPVLPRAIPIPIASLSFVGQPSVVFFTADNVAGQLNAEGCTAVEIAWKVDRRVCSGSAATGSVEVTDDTGAVLFNGVTPEGRVSVTSSEDRTYTLRATNTLRGSVSPAVVATLRVERYQRLKAIRKVSPTGLVMAGSVVTIEVEISCPADDPAAIVLSSDQPSRCPGLAITIPVGQTKATGQVNAGTSTGRVTLSGVVSGVSQASVRETFVVHNPMFDALIGASLEQCDGGSVTLRVRGATSVSVVELSGPGGLVLSNGPLQLAPSVPSDPAAGTLQVTARFGPLGSGEYAVQARADDVMLAAGRVLCALGNPSVSAPSATPNVVQVCIPNSVTVSATARRATELTITRSDGTIVGAPVTTANPCGLLTVTAVVQISGRTTFRAVAKRLGAPTATADVTVAEGSNYVPTTSRAWLTNVMNQVARQVQVPDGMGGTKTITIYEEVTLFVYVVSRKPNAADALIRVGTITSPTGRISYTPIQCELFRLLALLTDNPTNTSTTNIKEETVFMLGHPSFPEVEWDYIRNN
jgi:hypothetical protein